jgi:hypothetical protein
MTTRRSENIEWGNGRALAFGPVIGDFAGGDKGGTFHQRCTKYVRCACVRRPKNERDAYCDPPPSPASW